VTIDERQRARILRRDAELARLVDELEGTASPALAADLIGWGLVRDEERRSLAEEALERYRELNLLYDMAERSASLDPAAILRVAAKEVGRICRRSVSTALLTDEEGRLMPVGDPPAGLAVDAFPMGKGIVGAVAAGADGEIVNDPSADQRATEAEVALGPMIVAPLRTGDRCLGVLLVSGRRDADFTAGEQRMLSAVAALTAPALGAAMTHVRSVARARAREEELERQLDALRSGVDERRREERVSEITSSEYFQALRQQADVMRRALKADSNGGE
jgi:GAF domain-containing protein